MSTRDWMNEPKFWKVLEFLLKKEKKYDLKILQCELGLDREELYSYCLFIKNLGGEVDLGDKSLTIGRLPNVNLSLSLLEWVALQVHFPFLTEHMKAPYHNIAKNFLAKKEEDLKQHDFFEAYDVFQNSSEQPEDILMSVERAAIQGICLRVKVKTTGENIHCFPYRLSYIHNTLSLIGEDKRDKSLVCLPLSQVLSCKISEEKHAPNYSLTEVFSFIDSFRSFAESEERLILKIHQPSLDVNLDEGFHYFRSPSLIKSSRGDFIWSAYVEKGERLHEWLNDLWKVCEFDILAPESVSESFDKYLFEKMQKLKQVS